MCIRVFGGTGKTGQLVLQKGLEQGHLITAYARNPTKITIRHPNLTPVKGDLQDGAAIENVIQGADAVISVLGPSGPSPGLPISKGMVHIVTAMKKNGIQRFIATAIPSA